MSKVEEVARALREAVKNTPEGKSIPFEEMSMILARAAIEAMREPTQAMVDAAHAVPSDHARDHWYAMIDEAVRDEH